MIRISFFLLMVTLSSPCYGARIFSEVNGTRDSDNASTLELLAGYRQTLVTVGNSEFEMAGGDRTYFEPGERERFSVGRLELRSDQNRSWQLKVRTDFLHGDNWSPLLPAAFFSSQPNDSWSVELSVEREVVDSVSAIQQRLHLDSYALSADYRINSSWTVVGAAIYQRFSDGNNKQGGIGRIIYSLQQLPNFNLQLKGRLIQSDRDSIDYFSPRTLREGFLLLGYAAPFADDNWVIKLLGGPGIQKIDPFFEESQTKVAFLGELALHGWFNDSWQLVAKLGCTSANETRDAYQYWFTTMHLGYVW
ncbi:MAG: hypothetical protein IBX47_09600 [Desulfuromonadales bacterium]|nr:hypothetical protein [Desulfuromonadales bacterium]